MGRSLALALVVVATASFQTANAQDAAPTAGGDVTADESTPLPSVTVQSVNEPIRRRARPKRAPQIEQAAPSQGAASAADATPESFDGSGAGSVPATESGGVGIFTLGQLDVIGGSTITNDAMWTFNKTSLDQAVNLLPGVSSHNSGGSRNERDIYVRGFDRFRVPLSIDGVRIYLPADNRLDLSRFLTPDLSEVQVQKGYVSVLNGPGGLGGAINLVSRKPTKEVELEGRSGAVFNGGLDDLNAWSSYAFAGTRQKRYYAQVSGTIVDQDHFNLSDDFPAAGPSTPGYQPTFAYEDGGDRDRSFFKDWRVNAKVGVTPNATDEYSINYTVQQGEKGAPLHTDRQVVQSYFGITNVTTGATSQFLRFWDWPQWDTSTLSWLSKTQIGDASYVKSNAYYNTFDNTTRFFANQNYDVIRQDSIYDDHAVGGFVEFGTDLVPMNTLKGAVHFRRDVHKEFGPVFQFNYFAAEQVRSEQTWSFAAENTFHATKNLDLVTGVSYDRNKVLRADGSTVPRPEVDAWNGQGALVYSYSDEGKAHVSISNRTRFPTLFERYSTRFGAVTPNPNVDPERAINYEFGVSDTFFRDVRLSTAIFYADIQDSIQTAFAGPNGNNSLVGFKASGENYGLEVSLDWDLTQSLRIGGNYTYLERSLDYAGAAAGITAAAPPNAAASVAAAEVENSPRHKGFLYAAWRPMSQLTLTPSVELASDRTVLVTDCGSTLIYFSTGANALTTSGGCPLSPANKPQSAARPNYARIGSYALVNFQAEYTFDEKTTAAIGATNLLDENYSLADGFPEAGRQFFMNVRAKF